jgi:putative acetyltransferase
VITIKRTDSNNTDFIELVKQLDAYLKIVDGDDHEFYDQYNGIEALTHVVIAYLNDKPVGCGAFKPYQNNSVEIKRMFVQPTARKQGIAAKVLAELETWATQLNYLSCILETGKKQTEAVAFYQKCGYYTIPNYGQYTQMENSVCFEKILN